MVINDKAKYEPSARGNVMVNFTSIDEFFKDINVGFIKADIEGYLPQLLNGAKKTILRDRPVLELAFYHSYGEFYYAPEILKEIPNYIWRFNSESDNLMSMGEIALFGYPAELAFPEYPHE